MTVPPIHFELSDLASHLGPHAASRSATLENRSNSRAAGEKSLFSAAEQAKKRLAAEAPPR